MGTWRGWGWGHAEPASAALLPSGTFSRLAAGCKKGSPNFRPCLHLSATGPSAQNVRQSPPRPRRLSDGRTQDRQTHQKKEPWLSDAPRSLGGCHLISRTLSHCTAWGLLGALELHAPAGGPTELTPTHALTAVRRRRRPKSCPHMPKLLIPSTPPCDRFC